MCVVHNYSRVMRNNNTCTEALWGLKITHCDNIFFRSVLFLFLFWGFFHPFRNTMFMTSWWLCGVIDICYGRYCSIISYVSSSSGTSYIFILRLVTPVTWHSENGPHDNFRLINSRQLNMSPVPNPSTSWYFFASSGWTSDNWRRM